MNCTRETVRYIAEEGIQRVHRYTPMLDIQDSRIGSYMMICLRREDGTYDEDDGTYTVFVATTSHVDLIGPYPKGSHAWRDL